MALAKNLPLTLLLEATNNRGCWGCWMSSWFSWSATWRPWCVRWWEAWSFNDMPKFTRRSSIYSAVFSGGAGGARAPPEFGGSQKGRSLISAYQSLAITTNNPGFKNYQQCWRWKERWSDSNPTKVIKKERKSSNDLWTSESTDFLLFCCQNDRELEDWKVH